MLEGTAETRKLDSDDIRRKGVEVNVASDESVGQSGIAAERSSSGAASAPPRMSLDSRAFMNERLNADISKRYEIDPRELGAGGCGRVYLAKDRLFQNRLVAIKKVVQPEGAQDELLSHEVEIMKHLDHPSICKLFETYRKGRLRFFVMEFCAGGDLYDRFSSHGGAGETTVAEIMWQVVSALNYAHWRGIAHRDLKLENICFIHRNEACNDVKVIDWGFSKMFADGRMTSTVGTSTYSAPEVLMAEEYTGASDYHGYTSACDLWSAGVLTYVSLCGKPPFWGGVKDQLRRMRGETYRLSGPVWDDISMDGKDFIRKLLRFDPAARYSAAQAMQHPFLSVWRSAPDFKLMRTVLSNAEQFSRSTKFFALCVLSVARQIDHASLTDVRSVFKKLDIDGNGVLTKDEVVAGFRQAFDESEMKDHDVDALFQALDLGGHNEISYTEFCAAGMSPQNYTEEHVLWAAFKTFDIQDKGHIALDEMRKVLSNADIGEIWSTDVADEVMKQFGGSDQTIGFQDWLNLMKECSQRHGTNAKRLVGAVADAPGEETSASLSRPKPKPLPCLSGVAACLRFLAAQISE